MKEKTLFWTGCITSRALLILFVLSSGVGLMPDEAQYWTWSLFPDMCYYSKPPGIAWQIYLGTLFCGTNELGVRIISLLLPIGMSLLIKKTVSLLSDERAGYMTALFFLLSPLGMSGSLFATTDGGMLFFGLAAAYVYLKDISRPSHYLVGACIALGALWKWAIYLLLIPIILHERIQKRPFPYHLCAIACLGILPSLFWNMSHEWVTFRHAGAALFHAHASHSAGNFLSFLLAGVVLVSPLFFVLSLKPLFSGNLFLRLIVYIIFGGLLFLSLFRKVQGNWAVLGQIFLFPLLGEAYAVTKRKWLYIGAALLSLTLQALFLLAPYKGGSLLAQSPLRHGVGMESIKEALVKSGYTPNHFLCADRYQTVSELWFYTQRKAYFFNISHLRHNQFCFWPGMPEECTEKDGFFVLLVSSSEKKSLLKRAHQVQKKLSPYFASTGDPQIYSLKPGEDAADYMLIIPVYGYSGKVPEQKDAF